ncbi:MAG TPA: DnaJ domain-containing protein [Myxococcales bacterium]
MERNYWVRTEHGRIWGPYTISALERLRGQLTEKCEASNDGKEWHPGADFPELRSLLVPARKIERQTAAPAAAGPRISKAMAEAFGIGGTPAAPSDSSHAPEGAPAATAPAAKTAPGVAKGPPVIAKGPPVIARGPPVVAKGPPEAPRPPPVMPKAPPPPPPAPEQLVVPESGDLAELSPARLYAMLALTSGSGGLQLELDKGRMLQISFRRGTPEHLSCDDPELSLLRFLQSKGMVEADKALAAEEQAANSGQDIVSVLFQMQVIPATDAHRLLGEHAVFLLDRALATWRGKFTFNKDAPVPPGAFPLGSRWALLVDSVRRLDAALLRARLGKKLLRPVVRSGGLALGKVEELALNAQEARIYAGIDGTRTGEELLRAHETAATVRLLYLLTELGHLALADVEESAAAQEPPAKVAPPQPAPAAAPQRELPKTSREPPPAASASPRPAAPPVMKAAPPARPPAASPKASAPVLSRPPPTFAQGPGDESPEAAMDRLSALWERLAKADHFEVLGLDRKTATPAETKRNFFVLAKELHPDTVTDATLADLKEVKERLFARINEAAQVLGDEKRRKEYESELDGKAENVDVSRIFAAEENFQKAEIFIKARKYQEGLDLLEQAIQMNADEAEFYAWRGYAKFLLSKDRKQAFEECASDCRKALKMVERCLPAHLFLGHMAKALGDMKLAKKCYTRVLELDEKHIEAQRELRLMGTKG